VSFPKRVRGLIVRYGVYRPSMLGYGRKFIWIRTGPLHRTKSKAIKAAAKVKKRFGHSKILKHILPRGGKW
jgi:hypothetical protein